MNELISVIVPVYKVEKYLNRCIDSILNQTYINFECILVDDGSPDNCPTICDEYAKIDSRIKVIHKPNGGLSSARNAGLDICQGEYICFIDSDDFVDNMMIEKLYKLISNNDADISMCSFTYYYNDNLNHESVDSPIKNEILNGIEAINKLFEDKNWFYVVAWNKMYRRNLWKKLRYPNGYIHEDEAIVHRIFIASNKIVTTNENLYYYRQREGSIMNNSRNSERMLDKYYFLADRIYFLNKIISNSKMKDLCYKYWYNYINDFYNIYNLNFKSIYLKRMKKSLIKVIRVFIKTHFFTLKDTISILIFLMSADVYKFLFIKREK